MTFLSIQLLKELLQRFHLAYSLSLFFKYFFYPNFFLFDFCNSFFVKRFKSIFSVKITNNTCPRHSAFNSFNHKYFFRPIWNVVYWKNVFIFWYSNNTTNFKFSIFFITFFTFLYFFNFFNFFDIELMYL